MKLWMRKMLKAFYREVKTGDVWKERTNKKLKVLYNEPKTIRWMGHIEKFENAKMTKMVPSQKEQEKEEKEDLERYVWKA